MPSAKNVKSLVSSSPVSLCRHLRGSENKKIIDTELLYMYFRVTHWVAGKSVMASNSMIERVFHTLKNEFGSVHIARDGLQLKQILSSTIDAYMNRPHSAHGIYAFRSSRRQGQLVRCEESDF